MLTMHILVVDDEIDVVSLFRQYFKNEINEKKFHFKFVHSAEQALDYVSSQLATDLVLILSDINMPGMNGLELLRMLKHENPERPVFMITAYDNEKNRKLAGEYKADAYLCKPLDFSVLKEKVRKYTVE